MNNSVLDNIIKRRSVRSFTNEALTREELEAVVKAGVYAPTAKHIETRRLTVVTDKRIMRALEREIGRLIGKEGYGFYDPAAFILVSEDSANTNGLANCACAMQNMMLAASSLGLGSVWINQFKGLCGDEGLRALLDRLEIPGEQEVWACLSLGRPAKEPAQEEKDETVVRWFE
ncbi:MAG: nitroreductase family protein [Oscillospiraceae bacterium]|nr:nitroreductase family protein [Oscillospiraceae bacterium]